MTTPSDWVLDPFAGTGTSIVAAIRHGRRGAGAEVEKRYVDIAKSRITKEIEGVLPTRPMNKPVYDPSQAGAALTTTPVKLRAAGEQLRFTD